MTATLAFPRLGRLNGRFLQFVLIASIISVGGWLYLQSFGPPKQMHLPSFNHKPNTQATASPTTITTSILTQKPHPIDTLVRDAGSEWAAVLEKETKDLKGAAEAYRLRRGRHPPPGFEDWFAFAQKHDAIIIEDFFDQIYHDLNPFWGVESSIIRQQARTFEFRISVRNGTAGFFSDDNDRPWMRLWHELTSTIAKQLPDVDVPINIMDESRVVVPWETIKNYTDVGLESRRIVDLPNVVSKYTGLAELDQNPGEPPDPQWISMGPYWDVARVGCPPGAPMRETPFDGNFSGPPPMPTGHPINSYEGYVKNWTLAKDPCIIPNILGLHGTFTEPLSQSTTHQLFPIFGGSKLPINNEILLPPAMYWTRDEFYSGGEAHGPAWDEKSDKMTWRGAASGGRNKAENWTRFQRHRFVAMVNGTAVRLAESTDAAPNFVLPDFKAYPLAAAREAHLGDWLDGFSDAAFVNLLCFPAPEGDNRKCDYTGSFFEIKQPQPMKEQYDAKYLPDIDGNSFSGRYRGFLRSTSLPIKATIYSEWHDSRLQPWLHFVPMDNTFIDIYGIMEYFLGYGDLEGHDEVAKKLALGGKAWAEKVLRPEDMEIYVFRLLLEFARICDDARDRLGYVGDLLEKG